MAAITVAEIALGLYTPVISTLGVFALLINTRLLKRPGAGEALKKLGSLPAMAVVMAIVILFAAHFAAGLPWQETFTCIVGAIGVGQLAITLGVLASTRRNR